MFLFLQFPSFLASLHQPFPHQSQDLTSTPPRGRRVPVLFAYSAVSVAGAPQLGVYSAKARALEALCTKEATGDRRKTLEIGCVALLGALVADIFGVYPLVISHGTWPFLVDFSMKMVIFHSYRNYQRVE